MPPRIHNHDLPDRFIVGTVGLPGERSFFLQAQSGRVITSVALEKQQVSALADRIDELLDVVMRRTQGRSSVPALAREEDRDNGELEMPVAPEFRVGTMSLAWDTESERLIVECFEYVEGDVDETPEGEESDPEAGSAADPRDRLRATLTGAQGREFVRRAQEVVSAGRPDCPFCARPLEPAGHVCPRANGVLR